MMEWNWLDWTLAAIALVSVAAAIWEGLVRELISIASLVAGLALAVLGYRQAGNWFRSMTDVPEVALGLGFLALFFGTLIAGVLVAFLARKLIQKSGLQWFDRFLGGLFGLVRGFAICSVLLMAMVAFSIRTSAVQDSTLAPYVVMGARAVGALMPGEIQTTFDKDWKNSGRRSLIKTGRQSENKLAAS